MKSLLQRLSDNNPQCDEDISENEDKSDTLINEMLLLLSSRPRNATAEDIPMVNASVVNYGISDMFPCDTPDLKRNEIMQKRIELSLLRFEPRLKDVNVYSDHQQHHTHRFIVEAETHFGPVRYHITWDDILSHFSLQE